MGLIILICGVLLVVILIFVLVAIFLNQDRN